jgi:hypothetical protein
MEKLHDPYDPATVGLLRRVLEEAWDLLTVEQQARINKSDLAEHILALAHRGERDPTRLRTFAVNSSLQLRL